MIMNVNLSAALSIFADNLVDVRKACVENVKSVQQLPRRYLEVDDEWTVENIHLHSNYLQIQRKCEPLLRVIKRIDGRKKHYKNNQSISSEDIERAKEYPIGELFTELIGEKPRYGMVHCPFHPDATASMSLRRYNRYRCFGCDEKGSVIDLYMKVNGVDFISAVRGLI